MANTDSAMDSELRKRRATTSEKDEGAVAHASGISEQKRHRNPGKPLQSGTFWLTRIVFTRSLGFIYCEKFKHKLKFPFNQELAREAVQVVGHAYSPDRLSQVLLHSVVCEQPSLSCQG